MKVRHAETQSSIGFETAIGCAHDHTGWFVGVFLGENYFTVIDPPRVG